jgi:hypothetical protein
MDDNPKIIELLQSMLEEQKGMRSELQGVKAEQKAMKEAIDVTNERLDMTRQELWELRKDNQLIKKANSTEFKNMTRRIVTAIKASQKKEILKIKERVDNLELWRKEIEKK